MILSRNIFGAKLILIEHADKIVNSHFSFKKIGCAKVIANKEAEKMANSGVLKQFLATITCNSFLFSVLSIIQSPNSLKYCFSDKDL